MRPWTAALFGLCVTACRSEAVFEDVDPDLNRMLDQPRADAYEASSLFPDGKVLQVPPKGTVVYQSATSEQHALTLETLKEGRHLFGVHCAVCHGVDGSGESEVARFMQAKPADLHQPRVRALEPASIQRIIREGYGFMPSYAAALSSRQVHAIAAYVKALQLSQHTHADDLPPDVRSTLIAHASSATEDDR